MSNVPLRAFQKENNAHLLKMSNQDYKVGHTVDFDGIFGRQKEIIPIYVVEHLELPDGIDGAITTLLDELHASQPVPASIFSVDINRTQDFEAAVKIPSLKIDLSANLDLTKVRKFTYSGVSSKIFPQAAMTKLINGLQTIYPNFSARNRRFVREFYYADTVSIEVENGYGAELKGKLEIEALPVDITLKTSGNGKEVLSLSNAQKCPFAMKIESIGDIL